MKATLEFNLDDSDDRQAHLRAVKALDLTLALDDVAELFRKAVNSDGTEAETETAQDQADRLNAQFWQILGDRGINMDEILS